MYLILTFILLPFFSYASSEFPIEKLERSQKWLNLLHYKKNILGGYKSQADGQDFFLHPQGKTSPGLELKRSIELFSEHTVLNDDHPVCKFPLRFKWLNSQLGHPWKADFSQCKTYVEFFSKLAAKRATLVFSSYYLSNPNSAFGHTFLRLSRYDDKNETEMLDYGINYSAEATATDPFAYAFNGLLGGFKGKFAAIPYYYKVREYSNSEFRDLWSYDLNLTLVQVLEMVDHIWELGHTYFDYFYFKENCSYHLLSVIEVALPEKKLTDTYSSFAIPADTVRLLRQQGLIKEGRKRESTYSKLLRLSDGLDQESLSLSREIAKKPALTLALVSGLDAKKAASILDVSLEAFDYFNADKILGDDLKTKEIKDNILFARAKNPVITLDDKPHDDLVDSPARSHSPTRAEMSQGYEHQKGQFTRLELRASHHDLLDPPAGSLKDAQLEIGKISFRRKEFNYSAPHIQLEKLTLLNIRNLPEQNFWTSPLAWEIEAGARQIDRSLCQDCPAGFFLSSVGNSLQVGKEKRLLLAMLMTGELSFHNFFEENYLLGTGPKTYIRYLFSEKWVSGLEASYLWNTYSGRSLFRDHQMLLAWETRYHAGENTSLTLRYGSKETGSEWFDTVQIGLQLFY